MSSVLIPTCYEYIIGLSRTNCKCYTIPDDASESLSGLYLDELESLNFISAITNCENNGDVWEQMERSRQIAVTMFRGDVNALMMNHFVLRRQNFSGGIGRAVVKNTLTQVAGQWYGMRIWCENVKSGYMLIKNIGTIFEQTGAISLQIWNNLGELVTTVDLNTLANKHQLNTESIELPLHSPYIEHLEYYLIYQAGANQAKNNDLKCACGGFKPYFDIHRPYCRTTQHERNYMWSNWVMVGGFHANTLPSFNTDTMPYTTSNMLYGLTLEVDIKCRVDEVLCYESLDFEGNMLARAMAIAIQHKAASTMASWVINSGNLNRFTMINTEQTILDIAKWDGTYTEMIKYIAENVNITTNDCLYCKDIFEMARTGILA